MSLNSKEIKTGNSEVFFYDKPNMEFDETKTGIFFSFFNINSHSKYVLI